MTTFLESTNLEWTEMNVKWNVKSIHGAKEFKRAIRSIGADY